MLAAGGNQLVILIVMSKENAFPQLHLVTVQLPFPRLHLATVELPNHACVCRIVAPALMLGRRPHQSPCTALRNAANIADGGVQPAHPKFGDPREGAERSDGATVTIHVDLRPALGIAAASDPATSGGLRLCFPGRVERPSTNRFSGLRCRCCTRPRM